MNFRNISAWSIRNPVPPLVLFIALLFAGVLSFSRMQVNQDPDVDFPGVFVSISQPGAVPSELETQVTRRVEAAVRSVEGVDEISSTVREGSSGTFVQFDLGTPIDRAVNDVRDQIAQIRGDLPEGILEPQVSRIENDEDIATYVVRANDMTLEEVSWFVDDSVSKRLLGIEGVSGVRAAAASTAKSAWCSIRRRSSRSASRRRRSTRNSAR